MVVCLCRNISDREIKEVVCSGAKCMSDVNKCFTEQMQCGKCVPFTKQLIQETLATQSAS